jgi:hypothetical protein
MKSVLDFLIIIIYTETVYIFCPLGTRDLSNRKRRRFANDRSNVVIFDFHPAISVYVIAPNFEKSTQYFITIRKGMVEYHDKG